MRFFLGMLGLGLGIGAAAGIIALVYGLAVSGGGPRWGVALGPPATPIPPSTPAAPASTPRPTPLPKPTEPPSAQAVAEGMIPCIRARGPWQVHSDLSARISTLTIDGKEEYVISREIWAAERKADPAWWWWWAEDPGKPPMVIFNRTHNTGDPQAVPTAAWGAANSCFLRSIIERSPR